jgi:NifU-like protein involved in Fe-S cluster formation
MESSRFGHYPARMMEHFTNPRNVGEAENPTTRAEARNDACGDRTVFTLRVEGGIIADAKFRTYGCPAAIAASSALTELVRGMRVEEARALAPERLDGELGGLPRVKRHALDLALEALARALEG